MTLCNNYTLIVWTCLDIFGDGKLSIWVAQQNEGLESTGKCTAQIGFLPMVSSIWGWVSHESGSWIGEENRLPLSKYYDLYIDYVEYPLSSRILQVTWFLIPQKQRWFLSTWFFSQASFRSFARRRLSILLACAFLVLIVQMYLSEQQQALAMEKAGGAMLGEVLCQ